MKLDENAIAKIGLEATAQKMENSLIENGITDVQVELKVNNISDAEFLLHGPEDSVQKAKQVLGL